MSIDRRRFLQTSAVAAGAASAPSGRAPRWKGPGFEYPATALAVADMKGDGKLEAALSDGRSVYLYPYPPVDAQPIAQFTSCEWMLVFHLSASSTIS